MIKDSFTKNIIVLYFKKRSISVLLLRKKKEVSYKIEIESKINIFDFLFYQIILFFFKSNEIFLCLKYKTSIF